MTVNTSNITSGPYTGNGVTSVFDYTFRVEDQSQLRVFETTDAGVTTELTLTTDYTVSGVGDDDGGSITRVAGALPTGYTWYIRSNYLPTQQTAFASQGGFFPSTHEKAMDKLTFLSQQLTDRVRRSFRFDDSYSGTASTTLPSPSPGAYPRWNNDGSALINDTEIQVIINISGAVTTVANIAPDVTAVADNTTNINTVVDNIAAIILAPEAASDASNSATLASDWATKTDGPVAGSEYSAKYWAQQAAAIVQIPAAGIAVSDGTLWDDSIVPGTGVAAALAVNVGSAGAFVAFDGAAGTPTSLTLTNATGLPIEGGGTGLDTLGTANQILAVNSGATALEYIDAAGDLAVGDYLISARETGVDAKFLLATGDIYLQSTYPDLFAELGFLIPPKDYALGTKLANPSALPAGVGEGVAFSSDGTYMSVAHQNPPNVTIYKRSGDTFTKLANPSTVPTGNGNGVAFGADDNYMSVVHRESPFVTIYKRSGDTFTKLANPSALPAGVGEGVAFSSDGTYMSVAHATSPFITIYKRSGDTFTKLADPATLPTGIGHGVAFSSDDTYMSVAHATSPFVTIYKRSGDTFTKLANPATLPTGQGNFVAFSSDGTYMSVAHATSPFITIYKRSGDTFTKLADPATLPTGIGHGVAFSSDDTYMSVAHATSPFVTIYKRSGDTFTKLANPSALPAGVGEGVAFSSDGTYMSVAHATSPFVTIYKPQFNFDSATEFVVPEITQTSSGAAKQLTYIKATE